ncbi:MAG: phosphoribosylanthranilate isomerase [Cyclobacteriaceae bacterium]
MNKLLWKVCGMKNPENIRQVAALGPDYMGFIFYPPSPRYVGEGLDKDLLLGLSPSVKKVGVFVNYNIDEIQRLTESYQLDLIQLHGDEAPDQCSKIKDLGLDVIKAFRLDEQFDFTELSSYTSSVDYFLFDSPGKYYGGNSTTFDWGLLNRYDLDVPFFLSGGIGLGTLAGLARLSKPQLHALDVNSKFEKEPGIKNVSQLEELNKMLGLVSSSKDNI